VANLCYVDLYFSFSARNISKTAEPIFTKSSSKMANWQQQKVKLLVSELFRLLEGGSNRPLSLRTQLHKMQHGVKTELLVEKDSCAILAGHIFCNGMRFKLY